MRLLHIWLAMAAVLLAGPALATPPPDPGFHLDATAVDRMTNTTSNDFGVIAGPARIELRAAATVPRLDPAAIGRPQTIAFRAPRLIEPG